MKGRVFLTHEFLNVLYFLSGCISTHFLGHSSLVGRLVISFFHRLIHSNHGNLHGHLVHFFFKSGYGHHDIPSCSGGAFLKWRSTPLWMVYFMENPTKMDDLGVPRYIDR